MPMGHSTPQPHELDALLQLSMPAAAARDHMGVLPDETAVQLLSAAHARTRHDMDSIHSRLPAVLSNVGIHTESSVPAGLLAASLGHALHTARAAEQLLHRVPTAIASAAAEAATVARALRPRGGSLMHAARWGLARFLLMSQHNANPMAQHQAPSCASSTSAYAQAQGGPVRGSAASGLPAAAAATAPGVLSPSFLTSSASQSPCVLIKRGIEEFRAFRFPKQTNQLAFVFDPAELGLSISFGLEVFESGHYTPRHVHRNGHELFFVLAGECRTSCDLLAICWLVVACLIVLLGDVLASAPMLQIDNEA